MSAHAVHPEILLISSVIRTGQFQTLAALGISSVIFHVCKHEMVWIENYIARTGRVPSKAAVRQVFPDFTFYVVDDVEHWCEEVVRSHKRQSVIDLMYDVADAVDMQEEDKALALLQQGLTSIELTTSGGGDEFDLFDNWEEVFADVEERAMRARTTGYAGIPTGFTTLDEITGGLQGGWFFVVAARLGVGKTWTGTKIAWNAASTNHRVAYFSLEQSRRQIAMRVHGFASRQYAKQVFNPLSLSRGTGFALRDYKRFLADLATHKGNGSFYINDRGRGRVDARTIAATIQTHQPDIVLIDYLTLLATKSDDWRGTANLSADLQSLGQQYSVPLVVMSQVNRLGIGKDRYGQSEVPGAEHLSQADAIGQDADGVLTMAPRSERVMKMKLAKFRHGPSGMWWNAKFSPATGEYEEIEADVADDLVAEDGEVD